MPGIERVRSPRWSKRHRVIIRRAKVVQTEFLGNRVSLGRTNGWQWRCTAEECVMLNAIEQLHWNRTKTQSGAMSEAHHHIKTQHGNPIEKYLDRYRNTKEDGHGYATSTSKRV